MFLHQLQGVQSQWQTNFDQLRQAAPVVVPAPMQSAPSQMPANMFSPNHMHSYQGFGNNFYPPAPWPTPYMGAYPFPQQLPPPHPPHATAGQGGSKA